MAKLDLDLDDLTNAALKRMVKQLLMAADGEEQKILAGLSGKRKKSDKERNDLADLDEEMHGKPKTPKVEIEDIDDEEEDS